MRNVRPRGGRLLSYLSTAFAATSTVRTKGRIKLSRHSMVCSLIDLAAGGVVGGVGEKRCRGLRWPVPVTSYDYYDLRFHVVHFPTGLRRLRATQATVVGGVGRR